MLQIYHSLEMWSFSKRIHAEIKYNSRIPLCLPGHLINVVVLVLPLRHIVTLYLHILAALLLYMGHQISK